MANQTDVATVKFLLPDGFADYGVTDDIISAQLDATTQTKTILFLLRGIAARIAPVEDITESGSSRTMQFHNRLMAMITDWQARSDAEDAQAGNLPAKYPAKIRQAKRSDLAWPILG